MAMASERVTADVVEASDFPDYAERYGVMSVPKIVINDSVEFIGALPEPRFLAEVKKAVAGSKKR